MSNPSSQKTHPRESYETTANGNSPLRSTVLPSLTHLPVASSALLSRGELLHRTDRKFLTTSDRMVEFLGRLPSSYHVLLTEEKAWARYETCYFDTDDLWAFQAHLRGRHPRYKVRVRRHVERRRAFFEIKRKGVDQRTTKERWERDYSADELTPTELQLISSRTSLPFTELQPSIWTKFLRATVFGTESQERITVDLELFFQRESRTKRLSDLAIIELKQQKVSHGTAAASLLRELRIRQESISKYCAGVAEIHDGAKPRLRALMLKKLSRLAQWKTT